MMNNNELYHYGVPGMRWGVRKSSKSRSQNDSDDAKEARKIKKKQVNEMSNDELQKLNKRQQLEKQHKELNPGAIKKGLLIAGSIVAALGTITALYKYSKQGIDKGKEVAKQYNNKKTSQARKAKIQQFQKKGEILVKNNNVKISKLKVPESIAKRKTKAPSSLYFNPVKRKGK